MQTKQIIDVSAGVAETVHLSDDEAALVLADRAEWEAKAPRLAALAEIDRLERLETPRRLAEAVLTEEGKAWLTNNRAAIAAIRSAL